MVGTTRSHLLERVRPKLLSTGAAVWVDEPMSKHTTFRIGGPADLFCVVDTIEQLVAAASICFKYEVPLFVLGGGSNILVSDHGIRGVTIKNRAHLLSFEEELVTVGSGVYMPKLARASAEHGLTGCEFMQTIPGTVGGGVHQNARFRHPKNFDYYEGLSITRDLYVGRLVDSVTIMSSDASTTELSNEECQFVYEGFFHSGFRDTSNIIISSRLRLELDSPDAIRRRMRAYAGYRSERRFSEAGQETEQPLDPFTGTRPRQPTAPSAGCVFFNVPNEFDHPTGRMIDLCGLKGRQIGEAQISPGHANYVVNLGRARAEEVRALMELCKVEVHKKFRVELVEEIQFVGDW